MDDRQLTMMVYPPWSIVRLTACTNAFILRGSFSPGADSTPEATSTPQGLTCLTASATFSGVNPPASNSGYFFANSAAPFQSAVTPLPPYKPLTEASTNNIGYSTDCFANECPDSGAD